MRESLKKFAEYQEEVLRENDHKGGWEGMSLSQLYDDLEAEDIELYRTLFCSRTAGTLDKECAKAIKKECADIVNYAMMIFDNLNNQEGE